MQETNKKHKTSWNIFMVRILFVQFPKLTHAQRKRVMTPCEIYIFLTLYKAIHMFTKKPKLQETKRKSFSYGFYSLPKETLLFPMFPFALILTILIFFFGNLFHFNSTIIGTRALHHQIICCFYFSRNERRPIMGCKMRKQLWRICSCLATLIKRNERRIIILMNKSRILKAISNFMATLSL